MDEAYAHLEVNNLKDNKKSLLPPDGGWGYAVCIGVGFTFMLGFGSSNAFGILFNDFFLEQDGASGLPLVIGVYNGALSISGFLSGIALKKYTFRQVGLVGAGLFVLGDVLTIFVERTYQLVFTFGVIRGAGFGVMIPVSFTAFNCYFTKKRTAMMSANQTMSSMASITFPIMVTFLLSEYGFRWTLALIMAVDLHLVFAMLVMHPVEWHMIKVPGCAEIELTPDCESKSPKKVKIKSDVYDESVIKMLPADENAIEIKPTATRHESIQKSIMKAIYDNVEVDLLKDPRFVSTLVGLGFAFVSDVTYLAMEPMLLFSYGYTKVCEVCQSTLGQRDGLWTNPLILTGYSCSTVSRIWMQVASCVMIGAVADLLARFGLAVFTYFYNVDSKTVFFFGTCITMVLRIALICSDNLIFVISITAVSGLVRCSVQVLFPLVLVTAAPDRFPAALALHILFSGILMLVTDPLIGVIYETTGSYTNCFIAMSFCCLVCIVLWTIDYFVSRK